jgi:large subunit ribosomal protein L21
MLRFPIRCFRSVFKNRNSDWAKRDLKEATDIHTEMQYDRKYLKIMRDWKRPLELHQQYKERRAERESKITPQSDQESKLVLHSFEPKTSVSIPKDEQIFAVFQLSGLQYKVTKDDLVLVEKLPYEIGTQLVIDDVLLLGTPEYTLVGRPRVETAKVYASVEEQNKSEKVLIFKKRRRGGFKRLKGHRQEITLLRVDKIEHEVKTQEAALFLPRPTN